MWKCEAPPADLVDLLRWTLQNIETYFRGINRQRWIPRPKAMELVQACHDFTDSCTQTKWFTPILVQVFPCFCVVLLSPRKESPHCATGVNLGAGNCTQKLRNYTTNKRSGCSVQNQCIRLRGLFLFLLLGARNGLAARLWMVDQLARGTLMVMSPRSCLDTLCKKETVAMLFIILHA